MRAASLTNGFFTRDNSIRSVGSWLDSGVIQSRGAGQFESAMTCSYEITVLSHKLRAGTPVSRHVPAHSTQCNLGRLHSPTNSRFLACACWPRCSAFYLENRSLTQSLSGRFTVGVQYYSQGLGLTQPSTSASPLLRVGQLAPEGGPLYLLSCTSSSTSCLRTFSVAPIPNSPPTM